MTPAFRPLLNREARRRAAEVHKGNPSAAVDPLLVTPFDYGEHSFSIDDLPADVLDALHTVEHVERTADTRISRVRVPLWVGAGNRRQLPVGLVPLIHQYFTQRTGQRPLVRVPNTTAFNDVADPLISAALAAYDRVVVWLGAGVSTACMIAGIVAAFPDRRVAVIVPRRRDGGHLAKQLKDLGVEAEAFYEFAITAGRPPKVAVGPSAGLVSNAARHTDCRIVVATDAVNFCTSAESALRYETAWRHAKWLGLVPPDRQLAPLERDMVTSFFGPFQFELPAHGQVRRRVLFAEQRLVLPAGGGAERLVMRLVGELAAGGTTARPSRFGVVHRVADLARGPVAVLAHDDHHRRRLLRAQRPADRGRVAVVTPDELADLTELGVLVRADRRDGRPPLSAQLLVEAQTDRRPLLIVDALMPDSGELGHDRGVEYRLAGWVSLDAELGGYAEWDAWTHRRLQGERASEGQKSLNR